MKTLKTVILWYEQADGLYQKRSLSLSKNIFLILTDLLT